MFSCEVCKMLRISSFTEQFLWLFLQFRWLLLYFFLKKYYWRALSQPCYDVLIISSSRQIFWCFFSVWVFFHEDSRITGEGEGQGKGKGIFLTPHYHFRPLHGHLDISRAITAESSPVHIASSRALTGNLCFPSASS